MNHRSRQYLVARRIRTRLKVYFRYPSGRYLALITGIVEAPDPVLERVCLQAPSPQGTDFQQAGGRGKVLGGKASDAPDAYEAAGVVGITGGRLNNGA